MRRAIAYLVVVAVAISLVFVLRQRKRALIAVQVELLQSDSRTRSRWARQELQRIGRSAVRPVCKVLDHESDAVRAEAALTLANIGHAAAAGPLLEAAHRGDYPAADALAFIKHPRASEARASARAWLANAQLDELRLRLPVGGQPPTADCTDREEPRAPFQTSSRKVVAFPRSLEQRWRTAVELDYLPAYVAEIEPDAVAPQLVVAGRLKELQTEYHEAAVYFQQALAKEPDNQAAREGAARAERLGAVQRAIAEQFPRALVTVVLEHPTWRHDDVPYHICTLRRRSYPWDPAAPIRELVLCRGDGESAQTAIASTVPIFTRSEFEWMLSRSAHVGAICLREGDPAAAVVIRAFRLTSSAKGPVFDVSLYGFDEGTLKLILRVPSTLMPWVGDLDEDGDAEIVTWQHIPSDPAYLQDRFAEWPVVRTLVGGKYQVRTPRFRTILEPVAQALVAPARRSFSDEDHRIADYLAYAYEVTGSTRLAADAYSQVEKRYWQRAAELAAGGHTSQARPFVARALEAREHRLRLESAGEDAER